MSTCQNTRITRRSFVRSAAAVAAVPTFVPLTALGDVTKTAASERITLGFIGMGTQNRHHLGDFLGQKDVQILAVCDVDQKHVEDAAKQFTKDGRTPAKFNDFRKVMERDDVHVIIAATPEGGTLFVFSL